MKKFLFLLIVPALIYLGGCSEQNTVDPVSSQDNSLNKNGLEKQLHSELQAAKAATAKYHDIKKALADGYVDIDVVVPHMGHHFLNPALLDGVFDPTKPEILVYELKDNGHYKLVALEYAVPLSFPMPEGFSGSSDVWDPNYTFNIWTLHAWIWENNPNGVFAPFNPNVP